MLTASGSSNTTEALEISLFRGEEEIANFNPVFTYPIFGDEEAVFGYKGLDISLSFASHNLKPHVDISWDEQWEQRGDIKASDVRGALEEFLPPSAFEDESQPRALSASAAAKFSPPGDRLCSYRVGDRNFEIWCASLADPLAKEMMENAQVLVPLFIEGGTELQLDHDWVANRWKVFLLYQVHEKASGTTPYSLAGFATSYRVFTIPDDRNQFGSPESLALLDPSETDVDGFLSFCSSKDTMKSPLELPSRERISQLLILPPYQNSGHGPQLYNAMYEHLIAPGNILELTVEDPNEAFDDMRDVADLIHLRENNDDFASLAINTNVDIAEMKQDGNVPTDDIVDGAARLRIKKASKIMPRQISRLFEMQTLSKIPQSNRSMNRISRKEKSSNAMDRAYFYWRLYVKHRLFSANYDTMKDMEREERIEKLEATVNNVQDDYDRLLTMTSKRVKQASNTEIIPQNSSRKDRKRKLVVEDDEDEEDDSVLGAESDEDMDGDGDDVEEDEEEEDETAMRSSKRRRLAVR